MAGLAGAGAGGAAGAVRAGKAYVEMGLRDGPLQQALGRVKDHFRQLGSYLTNVGSTALKGGILSATPLAAATVVFARFDDAIRQAGAKAAATAEQFESMRMTAMELGRTTSFTAAEVANLMTELATAGFKPKQITDATAAVLDLARAAGSDAATSARILGAALNQFQMPAEESARVADILTAAANKSAVSLEDLGDGLKYVGPDAKRFNMSLEDTVAILGALGNVGIRGEMGGTALRRILTLSGSEAQKLQDIFGVIATDVNGNLRPIVDVLDEIQKSISGMGNAAQSAKLNEFFGILGITGASSIGASAVSVRQLADELRNSAGIARQTAEQMDAGIGGAWRRFKGAVEGTAIAVGEALAPTLSFLALHLTNISGSITKFVRENREVVTVVGIVVATAIAAGAALIGLGATFSFIGAAAWVLAAIVVKLKAAIAFLVSPVGLVTAAVAGLVYAWATMTESGQRTIAFLKGAMEGFLADAREIWAGVADAIKAGDWQLAAQVALAGIRMEWTKLTTFLKSSLLDALDGLKDKFAPVAAAAAVAGQIIAEVWADVKKVFDDTAEWLNETFVDPWREAVGKVWDFLKDMASKVGGLMLAVAAAALAPLIGLASALDETLGQKLRDALAGIRERIDAEVANVAELVGPDAAARREEIARERDARHAREEAELAAARAEFERLRNQAAAAAAGAAPVPGAAPGIGRADGLAGALGFAAAVRPAAPAAMPTQQQIAASVAGGFASPRLASQLGYTTDAFTKRQVNAAEDTARNTQQIVEEVHRRATSLRFW